MEEIVFLEEVFFRRTHSPTGNTIFRWSRRPTLSVMEGSERERLAVDLALRQLDRALGPVRYQIQRLADEKKEADILVYHLDLARLARVMKEWQLPPHFARLNFAHPILDEEGNLDRVFLFLDARLTTTDESLERRALKLLLAAMGMPGETSIPVRSIFFEPPPGGFHESLPRQLGAIDIRALRLLYAYLNSGDTPEDLIRSYRRNWRRIL